MARTVARLSGDWSKYCGKRWRREPLGGSGASVPIKKILKRRSSVIVNFYHFFLGNLFIPYKSTIFILAPAPPLPPPPLPRGHCMVEEHSNMIEKRWEAFSIIGCFSSWFFDQFSFMCIFIAQRSFLCYDFILWLLPAFRLFTFCLSHLNPWYFLQLLLVRLMCNKLDYHLANLPTVLWICVKDHGLLILRSIGRPHPFPGWVALNAVMSIILVA